MDIDVNTSVVTEITFSTMANIIRNSKKVNFLYRNNFCSDIHYEAHLELKYLKVFVQTRCRETIACLVTGFLHKMV